MSPSIVCWQAARTWHRVPTQYHKPGARAPSRTSELSFLLLVRVASASFNRTAPLRRCLFFCFCRQKLPRLALCSPENAREPNDESLSSPRRSNQDARPCRPSLQAIPQQASGRFLPEKAPDSSMPAKRKAGDLVWAVVRGYPNWPGQVMDPKVAPARVHDRDRKSVV